MATSIQPGRVPGPKPPPQSTLAPFAHPAFRMLWGASLVANLCMWMSDIAAAWMMTSLAAEPVWVALVQTAATLPVFLLGLPSGALADMLDRRRYLMSTQFWSAGVALVLCFVVMTESLTPPLLLALTFANGIGLCMRWPVFAAIVPELVPRSELPAALALNGVSMNASRLGGPLLAGALIASTGIASVFLLNAVLSICAGFVIMRWRREHIPDPLGRERFISAIRVGIQFARQSARVKAVLTRVAVFFFHSSCVLALLPLVARERLGGNAGTFTLLLACMGCGAIVAVAFLPRMRQVMTRDALVLRGALMHASMSIVLALSTNLLLTMAAMVFSGMAWIVTANSLTVSIQLALPDWVRARGMSIYQMSLMGGSAAGAATWGQIATIYSVESGLMIASMSGALSMLLVLRFVRDRGMVDDPTSSQILHAPVAEQAPGNGRVMVSIEFQIDPSRADAFVELMRESRRSRLRQGALGWNLMRDIHDPGRYTEEIVDESWTEHLRRFDRVTESDVALRERKLAFHLGESPPQVKRRILVAE